MAEEIKEAFQKVKQDILFLGYEISQIKTEIIELKTELKLILSYLEDIKKQQIIQQLTPTHPQFTPTQTSIPTDTPTHPYAIKGLISSKTGISTGNNGVPTDRQTNRQTDQHIFQHINNKKQEHENSLDKAAEILFSLDSLKKEVRFKFKRLTQQEMQVFSALYSLEDQGEIVDYSLLATTLNLSESSIRDYILKIQKKGIPIEKEKLNNKKIILHISQDLRKIASLSSIIQLREL